MSTFSYQSIHQDDIDVSCSNSDSDPFESPEYTHHRATSLSRSLLPVIPDLRFEQSYLKSIGNFVRVEKDPHALGVIDGKGKEKVKLPQDGQEEIIQVIRSDVKPIVDSSHHLVRIEWSRVAWVTVRDQVISPLLQGALWGVASYLLHPFLSLAGSHVRGALPSCPTDQTRKPGWWKRWIRGVGIGPTSRGSGRISTDIPTHFDMAWGDGI